MSVQKESRQTEYLSAAEEFADRVRDRFGGSVHAVVLYGSVARRTAGLSSDVDVLVLTEDGAPNREEIADLSDSIDFSHGYETFLSPVCLTRRKFEGLLRQGYPVAQGILSEGVALYDDGTFERIRTAAHGTGGRNAN